MSLHGPRPRFQVVGGPRPACDKLHSEEEEPEELQKKTRLESKLCFCSKSCRKHFLLHMYVCCCYFCFDGISFFLSFFLNMASLPFSKVASLQEYSEHCAKFSKTVEPLEVFRFLKRRHRRLKTYVSRKRVPRAREMLVAALLGTNVHSKQRHVVFGMGNGCQGNDLE